ncbi:rCG54703 [Rattus norvegicus]|uniref:RCG54703 n=1 Tax=Rattus norvegicus TaxID=10116 RepID=A6KFN4_RAT|nr:rCG54703 [Rattus norvegicus]
MCQKHDQPLVQLCVKDLDILCTQCSLSVEHQGHYTCPIKKAGSYHRRILEGAIETLKCKVKGVKRRRRPSSGVQKSS